MLEAVLAGGNAQTISALARARDIAPASAHRQVKTLVDERYLSKLDTRTYVAGPRLLEMLRLVDEKQVVANVMLDKKEQTVEVTTPFVPVKVVVDEDFWVLHRPGSDNEWQPGGTGAVKVTASVR